MKTEEEPLATIHEEFGGNRVRSEHPAFGTVTVVRTSGHARLFDSEFRHQHYITMRIKTAYSDRSLSQNWIHSTGTLVEVSLSEAQWARMLSSIGMGDGTPCTIQRMAGESVPSIAAGLSETQQHVNEFADHMDDVYRKIDNLEMQIKESKMTNKLRDKLTGAAHAIRTAASSNLRFVADSFSKHMESTVEAAKIEICSYASRSGVTEPPLIESDDNVTLISAAREGEDGEENSG